MFTVHVTCVNLIGEW